MTAKKLRLFPALTLILLLSAAAYAQGSEDKPCPDNKCRNEAAGIQFTAPSGWAQSVSKSDILDLTSPDQEMSILVWTTEYGKETKIVGDKVIDELAKIIKAPQFEKEGAVSTHNGMEIIEFNGKGKIDGQDILFDMTAVAAPHQVVFFLTLASPAGLKKHGNSYGAFYQSIKKLVTD